MLYSHFDLILIDCCLGASCPPHLFLSKQGALAAAQGGHDSRINLVRLIFVSTAEPRPTHCAPVAAPGRLSSLCSYFPSHSPPGLLRLTGFASSPFLLRYFACRFGFCRPRLFRLLLPCSLCCLCDFLPWCSSCPVLLCPPYALRASLPSFLDVVCNSCLRLGFPCYSCGAPLFLPPPPWPSWPNRPAVLRDRGSCLCCPPIPCACR